MDNNAASTTLNAEQALRLPSEQEAVDLDPASSEPPVFNHTTIAPSAKNQNILARAWYRYVSVSVPHHLCRDHLANERTALGYIRSAQAFAMTGVLISQFMRVLHSVTPDPVFGFFVVSVPLSAMCHIMALIITVLGCYRFLHWQSEMTKGFAISSGWEMMTVFLLSLLVLLCMFALVVGIIADDIDR